MLFQGHQVDSNIHPHTSPLREEKTHDFALKNHQKTSKRALFEYILPNYLIQFYLSFTVALSKRNTQHATGLEKTVKNIVHAIGDYKGLY